MNERFLTVEEAAKRLGLNRFTLYDMISQGRIAHVRFSPRTIRIEESEIEAFIERSRVGRRGAVS